MRGYPAGDEENADDLKRGRYLMEDDDADEGGGSWQQREQERKGCARQARHCQLIADVGDNRRADAHPDASDQERRLGYGWQGAAQSKRGNRQQGHEYGRPSPVPLRLLPLPDR